MKIAICGAGPLGLEAAYKFVQLGGSVTLFSMGKSLGEGRAKRLYSQYAPHSSYVDRLQFLVGELEGKLVFRPHRVLRVGKRFLGREELPPSGNRLADLFRVVFEVVPSEESSEESLPREVTERLGASYEQFEDFDLIIDARGPFQKPYSMGPGPGHALGEPALSDDPNIFYGIDAFENLSSTIEGNHTAIIGRDHCLAPFLESFIAQSNQSETGQQVSIIGLDQNELRALSPAIRDWIDGVTADFEQAKTTFERDLRKWRDEEDYIRAKIPRPTLPEEKVRCFPDWVVSSIDRLQDRTGLFLTLDQKTWDNQTAGAHRVLHLSNIAVFNGYREETSLYQGLRVDNENERPIQTSEPGFYSLTPIPGEAISDLDRYFSLAFKRLDSIVDNVLCYFSKR